MAICEEYKILLKEAESRKKKIKEIFILFKKGYLEKKINVLFHEIHKQVFEEIDCLRCANCCSSISPIILDNDIRKISKALNEKPSLVTEKYLKTDSDHDYIFKNSPCPFLTPEDHYCSIYFARPKACREYPHTDHHKVTSILNLTYKNVFVCPAVYLIVMRIGDNMKKLS